MLPWLVFLLGPLTPLFQNRSGWLWDNRCRFRCTMLYGFPRPFCVRCHILSIVLSSSDCIPCHFHSIHFVVVFRCLCHFRSIYFRWSHTSLVSSTFHRFAVRRLWILFSCQLLAYMFYRLSVSVSCRLIYTLYIRTIGFRIVFRVIFFPLLLIDIVVLCFYFVSITFHLFLPFCVSYFPSFFYFSGCVMHHWCLLLSTVYALPLLFRCHLRTLFFTVSWCFFVSVTQHPVLTVFRLLVSSSWHSFFILFFFSVSGSYPCFIVDTVPVDYCGRVRSPWPAVFLCRVVATVSCGSPLLSAVLPVQDTAAVLLFSPKGSLYIRLIGYGSSAFR